MIPGRPPQKPDLKTELEALEAMGAKREPLGRNQLEIYQLPDSFRFGEEQVCLAHFAASQIPPRRRLLSARGEEPLRILDPGSGSGILTLLLSALIPGSTGLAIEIMERPFTLLRANLAYNGLSQRFRAEKLDLRDLAKKGVSDELGQGTMDLVVANPPYFVPGTGPERDDSTEGAREIAVAREEQLVTLAEYLKVAAAFLKPGGLLTILHRPLRLPDVMAEVKASGLAATSLRAVVPHEGEKPSCFLLAAKKQASAGFTWQRDLVLRRSDGSYTDEVQNYYWESEDE